MPVITSTKNRRVADAVRLKKRALRERDRKFLVEGAQAVAEALAGPGLESLFVLPQERLDSLVSRAEQRGVTIIPVTDEVMGHLTSTVTPQGIVGVAPFVDVPPEALAGDLALAAVLCAVRDPGNAGTVLRSADAAGAGAVVFTSSSVDVYNPKTVRASAGSLFHPPLVREVEVEDAVKALRERGLSVYAADADGATDLYSLDLSGPTAFLFGNEAWGLPKEVAELADATVRVPIPGSAESLNLAAAASVCLFEASRQRIRGGPRAFEMLIAAAAHDIRSPLTTLGGFALTLLNRWATMNEEQRELMLRGIVFDAERMNLKVKHLVEAARLAAGTLQLSQERVDIANTVSVVTSFFAANPDNPEVLWESGDCEVTTDGERVAEAISGLIEAAIWWGHEGPVRVTASERRGTLDISVFRAGTSLSGRDAEALFAPRPPGSGAGSKIGLFLARGVAEALGGSAVAEVDEGLRLHLYLPLARK